MQLLHDKKLHVLASNSSGSKRVKALYPSLLPPVPLLFNVPSCLKWQSIHRQVVLKHPVLVKPCNREFLASIIHPFNNHMCNTSSCKSSAKRSYRQLIAWIMMTYYAPHQSLADKPPCAKNTWDCFCLVIPKRCLQHKFLSAHRRTIFANLKNFPMLSDLVILNGNERACPGLMADNHFFICLTVKIPCIPSHRSKPGCWQSWLSLTVGALLITSLHSAA